MTLLNESRRKILPGLFFCIFVSVMLLAPSSVRAEEEVLPSEYYVMLNKLQVILEQEKQPRMKVYVSDVPDLTRKEISFVMTEVQ